jgi:hypothetical protein
VTHRHRPSGTRTPGVTITTLITNHVPRHLEGSPEAASAALRRLEPLQPLRDGLTALGLAHLVSLRRTEVPAATATEAVSFGLAWPLADGSSARVAWTLSVAPAGDGDSLLSASIRAGTDSAAAGQQLLTAWALLGRIVESHTTRLLNTVTELADQLAENSLELAPAPLVAAA